MNLSLKYFYPIIFFSTLFCIGCQENKFFDEMIEQFLLLDKTISKSNKEIIYSTEAVIAGMEENAIMRTHYLPLLDKAKEIQTLVVDFNTYIDTIRGQLLNSSGGVYTKEDAEKQGKIILEGRPIGCENIEIPSAIFKIHGDSIQEKILQLRRDLLQLIEGLWDNGGIKGTVFVDSTKKAASLEELKKDMQLSGIDDYNLEKGKNKTWAEFTFGNKPVVAICPILCRLQNDAILLESISVNFLAGQQATITLGGCLDYPFLVTLSSTPYIHLGESYQAQLAFVEHFSQGNFSISVNNQDVKVVNRIATYQTKPTSIGKKKYTAKVAITNPLTGETETFTKDFHYEVVNSIVQ